jgi:hypothetical protein
MACDFLKHKRLYMCKYNINYHAIKFYDALDGHIGRIYLTAIVHKLLHVLFACQELIHCLAYIILAQFCSHVSYLVSFLMMFNVLD